MFVQKENFDKVPYNVPAKQLSTDGTTFSNQFSDFVETMEEDLLKKLLGIKLYDAFMEALEEDYPEDKWLILRDGTQSDDEDLIPLAKYEYNGITYEWVGLRKLLTQYIYAMWLRDNYDNHDSTGISVAKVENAEMISPALRIVTAWNKMYAMAGGCGEVKNSLYGFLTIKESDYSDWVYTDVGSMNRFNL